MPWVAAMALGFFAAAEWVERWMHRRSGNSGGTIRSLWPRVMAGSLGALAMLTLLLWSPLQGTRTRSRQAVIERNITNRTVAIESAELADLMRDRGTAYAIFDVREEGDYNRFHLLDAERVAQNDLSKIVSVPAKTIKVLIAPDEGVAKNAYRTLAMSGVENLYWLIGPGTYAKKIKRVGGGAAKSGGCGG